MTQPTAKVAENSRKRASSSARGSKAGERRGGRDKGTPNKATASIRDAAREYTDKALKTLVDVMEAAEAPHAARVSAANSVLDRAFGKPGASVDLTSSDGTMSPPSLADFYAGLRRAAAGEEACDQ